LILFCVTSEKNSELVGCFLNTSPIHRIRFLRESLIMLYCKDNTLKFINTAELLTGDCLKSILKSGSNQINNSDVIEEFKEFSLNTNKDLKDTFYEIYMRSNRQDNELVDNKNQEPNSIYFISINGFYQIKN